MHSPETVPHFLRFVRALTLASGLAAATGCVASEAPDARAADAIDVAADDGDVAADAADAPDDAIGLTDAHDGGSNCVCCIGLACCPVDGAPATPPPPPPGLRYCYSFEHAIDGGTCPVCGPLSPPELA